MDDEFGFGFNNDADCFEVVEVGEEVEAEAEVVTEVRALEDSCFLSKLRTSLEPKETFFLRTLALSLSPPESDSAVSISSAFRFPPVSAFSSFIEALPDGLSLEEPSVELEEPSPRA